MTVQQIMEQFKELDERICHYSDILSLVNWDSATGAPPKGTSLTSKAKGTLASEMFRLTTSEEMGSYLETLTKTTVYNQLDDVTKACVRERKRSYDKAKRIPPTLHKEFVIHSSNARKFWEEAKSTDNFAHFQPSLEKMVEIMRRFIDCYGYDEHPYDALLDNYEPQFTVKKLDTLFSGLRTRTIELLERVQRSSHQPNSEVFTQFFDVAKQKEFSLFILPKLGYDLDAGRLDESAHPFATGINTGDVRITTRYHERDPRGAIFGTIHECGHALYEQGVNPDLEGTIIRRGTSMGIHESQSRFLENIVGRSYEFWTLFYPDLQRFFPEQFKEVSVEEFYRAVNAVEPSFIRVEADELTYNLHIMIRYEIEKALMASEIEVKDLPDIWNEKIKEYLGITPPSNSLGVLQDIHWSFGGFGYFPSYSLGNLYAAQIRHTLLQQMPSFTTLIAEGNFTPIREWLREQIHQYGKMYTPAELIMRVTGEELNAAYLMDYLEEKYTNLYQLD